MDDNPEPSRVIHFRNVTAEITQEDITELAVPFGPVANVLMLRDKKQALLQFQSVHTAMSFMSFFSSGYAQVGGRKLYVKYSRHQELTGSKNAVAGGNRILLCTLVNPLVDLNAIPLLTAELLFHVFSPYGVVSKIVMVQKDRCQCLVQYADPAVAEHAKSFLQGREVTIGTPPNAIRFTLDIQFSNLDDLIVKRNSAKTMDFSSVDQSATASNTTIIPAPAAAAAAAGGLPPGYGQYPWLQYHQAGWPAAYPYAEDPAAAAAMAAAAAASAVPADEGSRKRSSVVDSADEGAAKRPRHDTEAPAAQQPWDYAGSAEYQQQYLQPDQQQPPQQQ